MKRIQYSLFIFFLLFPFVLGAQNLDPLSKSDYTNQQRLLIKSEVRKLLGDRANTTAIKDLTSSLIPWAMMEEITPKDFARNIYFISKGIDAGIGFETTEDLIPILSKFKGNENDFLLLALSLKEAESAALPLEYRDSYLANVILRGNDGISILTGMRLLILSRSEKKETEETLKLLQKNLPLKMNQDTDVKMEANILDISKKLNLNVNQSLGQKLTKDIVKFGNKKDKNNIMNVKSSMRDFNSEFVEMGRLEMRERPRLEWTMEDLNAPETTEQGLKDWKSVSVSKLDQIVKGWIGTRYLYGGSSKTGTDCSGFTKSVLVDKGIDVPVKLIPRSARDQAKIGSAVSRNNLNAGDLVFFSASPNQSKITHVGLSLGKSNFVHASSSRGVVIQSLDEKWWTGRYTSARRIFIKTVK